MQVHTYKASSSLRDDYGNGITVCTVLSVFRVGYIVTDPIVRADIFTITTDDSQGLTNTTI